MKFTHTIGLLLVALMVGALLTWFATSSRNADLQRRIETAEQPRDHAAIAQILVTQAQQYEAAAALHRRLAAKYQQAAERTASAAGGPESSASYREMAAHCLAIAEGLEKAASGTRALAHGHERLAVPRSAQNE